MTIPGQDGVDRELVDLERLAPWMDEQGLPTGDFGRVEVLAGGTQNILVRLERGGRSYVLRRPPRHLRKASNEVLRREARVLSALAGSDVPHPGLIAACPDEDVLGVVFYLMEPVDGFNAAVELPTLHASNSQVRYQMGLAMVDALAVLAKVDHKSVGLADFGRPEGFLERQVPRWLRELQSYTQLDNYGDHGLPTELVATWLTDNRPATGPIGIMHGDFHIANAMFDIDGPTVAAIVDWEMCTIGDPMLDLGWLLATWPDPDQQQDMIGTALTRAGGLPPREVLIQRYGERTGFDVSAADWYTVLACFKLGIILEGTYARSCAGLAPVDVGRQLHSTAVGLFDRARRFIDRK
jgi:aminoglycoside phosphotransferase (APT) family kinase protein